MSRLPLLAPSALEAKQASLRAEILERRAVGCHRIALLHDDGSLDGPFNALLFAPDVGSAVSRLGEAVRFATSFTPRQRELVTLVVAAQLHSAYEWSAHAPLARAAGLSDHELAALRVGDHGPFTEPPERVLLRIATEILHRSLEQHCYDEAVATLGNQAVVEVVVLVGYYRLLADLLDTFDVKTHEDDAS